uniref:Mitochondrial uncoupling protein 4 n=1 Tax=Acrobeloides nanus TaxID=290746 RepID=A0A914BUJ6_9BILA
MRVPGDVQESSSPYSIVIKYFLSCSASMVAETVTYPLDITKTRLQISQAGLKGKLRPRGMLKVTYNIARHEGFMSLWQGLAPAIYRHYVYTGIRTGIYEYIRGIWRDEGKTYFSFWKSLTTGLLSGAVAQFVASPADLVKVQMQMEGLRKRQNLPPRFKSSRHAFASIYRTNGFFGMWTGWIPNCQRAALVNMADMATYDRAKHFFINQFGMKDSGITHACASSCSGLAAAIISTPADVVKTRIMDQLRHLHDNQHSKSSTYVPMYKGSLHCFMHIIKSEGFFALYRGFLPTYMRMAPWSLTFWVSYEKIRYLTGAPSF